ncbi:hypothetical protein [Pelagerythrobacter sp.]|uniref:hypothetical protein n=1 Tax=Pelagerythrobacter sp. TaxID=2800702 RepID=UPI0035B42400
MDWGGPAFVIAIIVLSTGGWLINNWIRAKHGYALENEWGGTTERTSDDASKAELKRENAALRGELKSVHDRVAVLERIVTDKGYGVAEQIEALRHTDNNTDRGTPLDIDNREKAR